MKKVFINLFVVGNYCNFVWRLYGKKPKSIYDCGLDIVETDMRFYGNDRSYLINDKLVVSNICISKWKEDVTAYCKY